MMLAHVDDMQPYERQMLLVLKLTSENSPWLNETQKLVIERKLQEIVDVWTKKDFV